MANKNLDGIKKLSGEELKRAREIVLDFIGEKDKRNGKEKNISPKPLPHKKSKMIDGLSFKGGRKTEQITEKSKIPTKVDFLRSGGRFTSGGEVKGKNLDIKTPSSEIINTPVSSFQPAFRKKIEEEREEEGKKGFVRKGKKGLMRVIKKSVGKPVIPPRLTEAKKVEGEEKRKITGQKQEEIRLRKIKEADKTKDEEARGRIEKAKEKIKEERKRQRKIKRKFWLGEKKKQWPAMKKGLKERFKKEGKVFVFPIMFLVVFIVLAYLVFALLLLRFNLDSKISRQIAQYVPVPAVVAKTGWIEYYDYLKIKDDLEIEYNNEAEFRKAAKTKFIEEITLIALARKYNIDLKDKGEEEIAREINMNLAADKGINKVSYSRINKIKQLTTRAKRMEVAGGQAESFEEIGKKYGDEQGYVNEDNEYLQLKDVVRKLETGEISDIIITDRGYYIVKKEEGRLKYVFVKSVTFNEYFNDLAGQLKVWLLAS